MKFISVREFRANTAAMREELAKQQIVLTSNGHPFALVTPVEADSVMEESLAIAQTRARLALDRAANRAGRDGRDATTMDEIDAIVAKARAENRAKTGDK